VRLIGTGCGFGSESALRLVCSASSRQPVGIAWFTEGGAAL